MLLNTVSTQICMYAGVCLRVGIKGCIVRLYFSKPRCSSTLSIYVKINKGVVSKETAVLHRWGSSIQKLGLSTELVM